MKIIGVDGMSAQKVNDEVARGARFVVYQYTISLIVITLKRGSSIYFIPVGHSPVAKGVPFVLLSLIAGWWGIPWGPIYTISTVAKNLGGGIDVTAEVVNQSRSAAPIMRAPGA